MTAPGDSAPSETSDGLRVTRSWESDRLVLVLRGDLDMDTLAIAQQEVTAAEGQAPPVLVLDLSQLAFVDSSGVRLVLLAQQEADDTSRRFAVRLGHGSTRRLFDMLGITARLEVLDDGEVSSP
ncbi:STAS domain-containing protein [Actinomycetospora sp. TBRC 11914]|uniref:STAS domain-containing protein n=1 Tax=Actinomycetospora sp. TBRC 11914 TaxID=2729387 RepID=UPI00145EC765|nr:STAS domain-containing protein [Actinomycetospora sp. TBRC 11914]NMO88350.1 STAS domain-containing protein [Actinomycetospora sp. TBRC 11914]